MLRRHFLLGLGLGSLAASTSIASAAQRGRFVERALEFAGRPYRYQVFLPAEGGNGAPVLLFLHGSGERGSDGQRQTQAGLGPYLRRHLGDFPAVVVLPQAPLGERWRGANAGMALAALEAASAEFGADRARSYLTGMSMGGYGTWEIAMMQPQRFAALVPVCGGLHSPGEGYEDLYVGSLIAEADPYPVLAARLRQVPVWMFHGALDDVVPPEDDRRLYAAARRIGAPMRYTEYPQGNHNAWDAAYADRRMWEWLFAQRRAEAAAG